MDRPPLPDLRFVPLSRILLHEEVDPVRVRRYRADIVARGVLIDPPIVAPLPRGRFLLLDGANRVTVFRQLRVPHLPVQVVRYGPPDVRLQTWNHVVCDRRIRRHAAGPTRQFTKREVAAMVAFVRTYKGRLPFRRVVGDGFAAVRRQHPDAVCLVRFPRFTPRDIVRLALRGQLIPSGITRHIVSGRVLGLRVPLRICRNRMTLARKNAWLKGLLRQKISTQQMRYYAEPVYVIAE